MAIPDQLPRNVSVAAPGADTFAYDFKIFDKSQMLLEVDGVEQVVDVDFTIDGVGEDSGGNVELVTPLVGGETVVRARNMLYERLTDFQNLGDLRSATMNNDQDAPIAMIQQVAEVQARTMRLPISAPVDTNTTLPIFVPLAPLVVNAAGDGFEMGDTALTGDMLLRGHLANDGAGQGSDLVTYRDTGILAAPPYLKTVSDILQGLPVNAFVTLSTSHIADIRAGVDSDSVTASISALLLDMQAANRGHLILSKGVYCLEAGFSLLSSGGISQFRISGEAGGYTILKRNADFAESVYNISGIDNLVIEDVAIDGGHATYSGGNHGIAISNGSNIRVRRVQIRNHKNTGILIFQFPNDTRPLTTSNNVVEDCLIDGLGEANNGILLGDAQYSGIRGCHVRDLGKTGSPQYALQIKGISNNCFITNSSAVNARAGIAFGQETAESEAVIDSLVADCIVRDCTWGAYIGLAARNTFNNISIDMEGAGSHGIELVDSQENTFKGIKMRGQLVGSGAYSVKFGGTSSDNHVEFSSLQITDTIPEIVICETNSLNNSVVVDKLKNTATLTYTDQGMNDSAATAGNSLAIGGYVTGSSVTIASGAILVKNPKAEIVRVNTEASAATDDLDTITGAGRDGQRITIKTVNNGRDVTVKHGTGNISLAGGADFAMLTINYRLTLQWDSSVSKWCEISRAANT